MQITLDKFGNFLSTENIKIESLAYQGAGVGRSSDGKTVFVNGAIPGDLVSTKIIKASNSYDICAVDQLVEPSSNRITAKCQYSDICGGCPWQNISYQEQLVWKRSFVVDALTRIGKFADAEILVDNCLASKDSWAYRNKAEFSVVPKMNKLQLGLHGHGDSAAIAIDKCLLLPKHLQTAPKKLSGALAYALKDASRDLLRVAVRSSLNTRDTEVAVWMRPGAINRHIVAKVIGEALPSTSVVRVLSSENTKKRQVKKVEVLSGNGYWREKLDHRILKLSAPSFFQVNSSGAEQLINQVLQKLEDSQIDSLAHILDLYCGAGTFTLPLAEQYMEVTAIEASGSSLRDLRRNLEDNQLNAEVIGGDVARELTSLSKAQAAIIDPPRTGLSKEARIALASSAPNNIVYVSCNPTTLARDLAYFIEQDYKLKSVTPVDLFPQTYHIESVALLCK